MESRMPANLVARPGTSGRKQTSNVIPLRSSELPEPGPRRPDLTGSAPNEVPDRLDRLAEGVDRVIHASMGRLTGGLSPAALAGAYADWAVHLAFSPGKQVQLIGKAARKWSRFANHMAQCVLSGRTCEPCIEPLPQDRRFAAKEWQSWPYNILYQ